MSRPESEPTAQVVVRDVSNSQVIVGEGNYALKFTINGASGYSDRTASEPLRSRPLAVINPRRGEDPVGRVQLVDAATTALLDGFSVQLCGGAGVGKTAVAEAVARRLADRTRPGIVLAGGRPRDDLTSLYTELAKLFFSVAWYTPDEAVLRAETARHRPCGVVVVPDFALSAQDSDRLLGTFPDCLFLLCSRQQSLYSGATVLDVEPLGLDEARQLVAGQLGRPLDGFENLQVERIHQLGEGRIARLLVCAAFLRRAADAPRPHDVVPLSPREQTSVLVTGLSESARRALVALAAYGPAPAELFDALTGLEGIASAARELEYAGLVTDAGGVFTLTPDARDALAEHDWRADPRAAADGLQPLMARAGVENGPSVDPGLCVAVARALMDTDVQERALSFARVAAPVALAAGDIGAWRVLVAIGVRAAGVGRRGTDLAYFLSEQHTDALLRGDRVAAAAALTALAADLARGGRPLPPPTRPGIRTLRHALKARYGGPVATAVIAAAGVGAVAAVAGAAVGSAAVTRSGHHAVAANANATAVQSARPVAFPYTVTDQPYNAATGGAGAFQITAEYPVITSLSNNAVEQKINAELRAPLDQEVQQYRSQDGTNQQANPNPGFFEVVTSVYQAGSIISVQYLADVHYTGAGDRAYTVQSVTVRTDTGAVIPNSALLAPAALTTGFSTLETELQAQPEISVCDEETGWQGEAGLAAALHQGTYYTVTVTNNGLLFSFADNAISSTPCRPVGLLTWSALNGLVNPLVEQLTGSSGATTSATTSASPTPTTRTATSASPTPSASPSTPAGVVQAYYAAINAKNYQLAWNLGGDRLNSSYSAFENGFAQTQSDSIVVEGVNGETVTVEVTARQADGATPKYYGTYTVSGGVIIAASLQPVG